MVTTGSTPVAGLREQMSQRTTTLAVLIILLTAGGVGTVAAQESSNTSSTPDDRGEQSAQKNDIMQSVLQPPSNQSIEERRRVVSWLLAPGNLDKLSTSDREAVRGWLSEATEAGVNIPSRDALERALNNAEAGRESDGAASDEEPQYDESCEWSHSPALCVTNETWTQTGSGWRVTLTYHADYPHQVTLTDSGAFLTNDDGEPIPQKTVTVSSGYTRISMKTVNPNGMKPVISASGAGTLLPFRADTGSDLWAFIADPDTDLFYYAIASGVIGTILSLLLSLAHIKHREKHKWYDLMSEDYVSPPLIRGEPGDEAVERARKTLAAHRTKLTTIGVAAGYALAVHLGYLPTPQEWWNSLATKERLILLGSGIATLLAIVPVYAIASWYQRTPNTYVLDLDAEDVVDKVVNGAEGAVGMYRGQPRLRSDIDVEEGSTVTLRGSDGRVTLVREFDPARNRAKGVLDGLHDDREVAIGGKALIHSNHNRLQDQVDSLKQLLYRVPGITVGSETTAARNMAEEGEKQMANFTTDAQDVLADVFDDMDDTTEENVTDALGDGITEEADGETEDTPKPGE